MDLEGARILVTVSMEDTPDFGLALITAMADVVFGADIIAPDIMAPPLITADMVMADPIRISVDLTGIAKVEALVRYLRANPVRLDVIQPEM